MKKYFSCIGIIGHPRHFNALTTHKMLWLWLKKKGYQVIIEKEISKTLAINDVEEGSLNDIGKKSDLAIIIGGDGNLLSAGHTLSKYHTKIIGINQGNLGFLTDIDLNNTKYQLNQILQGKYFIENRLLLEVAILKNNSSSSNINSAINEIVFYQDQIAHMIEFEVYIDDIFAFSQRSDGLIISTPTGSTAYSLSAGGPILSPLLEAIVLVPMFPHSLSARPLVINSNSKIRLHPSSAHNNLKISCDGQIQIQIREKEDILIQRSNNLLKLIHPINYNYFNKLNLKLGWSKSCTQSERFFKTKNPVLKY